jgi:hypothetical protein
MKGRENVLSGESIYMLGTIHREVWHDRDIGRSTVLFMGGQNREK